MKQKVHSYRDLLIWQKGIELAKVVYTLTRQFPKQETYALADQMQRSAVSIPSNIAEGQARQHSREFKQFLHIALGSMAELDTQAVIALGLNYISPEAYDDIFTRITELQKMIYSLLSKLPR